MDVTANGIIYNKTAFEQAGVEVPQSEEDIWTWEEYEEALKKVIEGSAVSYTHLSQGGQDDEHGCVI